MKAFLLSLLVVAMCTLPGISSTASADGTIVIKTGSFAFSDDTQNLSGGVNLTFDEDASGVFGVEGEWHVSDKVAIGGEFLSYSNDWDSNVGTSGDVDTIALMFNARRYFGIGKLLRFHIGSGIGLASTDFEGPGGSVSDDSIALQAMGGLSVQRGQLGFFSELKLFVSEPEDDLGDEIEVSGTGLFAGITFAF
ncbi:MAG: outer membrane beta-barrel protein [Acidiferrobacterales bacterium]